VAVLAAAALILVPPRSAGAQDGSTEPSVPELLVPADPSATTAPAAAGDGDLDADTSSSTTVPATGATGDDGLAASTKVWIIIGGLVGVALLVLLLTILYWRRTKPSAVAARQAAKTGRGDAVEESEDDGAAPVPGPAEAVEASEPVAAAPSPAAQPAAPTSVPTGAGPGSETPRPVGDDPPVDPRRSVFAPPPPSDEPPPG
jgi:hypothetical protein